MLALKKITAMNKRSSYFIIGILISTMVIGCASVDHVMYFKPSAENGEIKQSDLFHIDWYPSLPNLITFPDTGIDVFCPNESYNVIYSGPILSTEPLLVLPLVPGLLGFIISPLDFNPNDVIIELHFDENIMNIHIDPKSIALLTPDGIKHSPTKITYGLGYRYYFTKDFVSDNVDLSIDEPIVIDDEKHIRHVAFFFDLRAWKTGSFNFSASDLMINNKPVDLPQISFKKKNDLWHFINVD
jgi:hypothetical protein